MKFGLLSYDSTPQNLGDYIQSIAIRQFLPRDHILVDREKLDHYDGEQIGLILNGWYMTNPKNWPPSSKIVPFITSFHINHLIRDKFLSEKCVNYLKKHEPIGCRDYYTLAALESKGISAYYSSCATLMLEKAPYVDPSYTSELLVAGVLDRLMPHFSWAGGKVGKMFADNLISLTKLPNALLRSVYLRSKLKRLIPKELRDRVSYTKQTGRFSEISEDERFKLAEDYLKRIANAKLVITSRIHTALPCLAFGVPVLFIEDGLEHINAYSRLVGIRDLFTSVKLLEVPSSFDIRKVQNPDAYQKHAEKLKADIRRFVSSVVEE